MTDPDHDLERVIMAGICIVVAMILVLWIGMGVWASKARSHEFYDPWCCNGQDCAVVPPGTVRWTPEGWHVRLTPADHPWVTDAVPGGVLEGLFPLDLGERTYASPDRVFHVCVWPQNTMRCIYVPGGEG